MRYDDPVAPYTLTDFTNDLYEACKAAWEDGRNEITTVRIPKGMFPDVAEFRNPITRSIINIEHVDMLNVGMCVLAVPVYKYSDWTIS